MIRKHFVAGVLFWIPVIVTIFIIKLLFELLVSVMKSLPEPFHPKQWLGYDIPGLELVIILLLIWVTGVLVANFLGKRVVSWGESLVNRIPLIRSVYSGVKQTMQVMAAPDTQSFRQVVLIQFPHEHSWVVGLVTHYQKENDVLTVFVPTTPNPTSGYVVNVSRSNSKEVDMSVDEALKYIISLGTISHKALARQFKLISEENN